MAVRSQYGAGWTKSLIQNTEWSSKPDKAGDQNKRVEKGKRW